MECKAKNLALHWLVSPRINRTILECKDSIGIFKYNPFDRINRTILECKDVASRAVSEQTDVLIEPYWNVKTGGTVEAISLAIAY